MEYHHVRVSNPAAATTSEKQIFSIFMRAAERGLLGKNLSFDRWPDFGSYDPPLLIRT